MKEKPTPQAPTQEIEAKCAKTIAAASKKFTANIAATGASEAYNRAVISARALRDRELKALASPPRKATSPSIRSVDPTPPRAKQSSMVPISTKDILAVAEILTDTGGGQFAHLTTKHYGETAELTERPIGPEAKAILTAAAKARTPTGTETPPPTGIAAAIIAAGRRRRGEAV